MTIQALTVPLISESKSGTATMTCDKADVRGLLKHYEASNMLQNTIDHGPRKRIHSTTSRTCACAAAGTRLPHSATRHTEDSNDFVCPQHHSLRVWTSHQRGRQRPLAPSRGGVWTFSCCAITDQCNTECWTDGGTGVGERGDRAPAPVRRVIERR